MRITLDRSANAAYIYLDDFKDKEGIRTVAVQPNVLLDVDRWGVVTGIELLNPNPAALDRLADMAKPKTKVEIIG